MYILLFILVIKTTAEDKTFPLQSPWLSPKLYSTVQITPCNKDTSPLRSLLPSPVADLKSEVPLYFNKVCHSLERLCHVGFYIRINYSVVLFSILVFIPDDVVKHFNRLRSAFLATGRGRRPKLPTFTITNKFLIQLYFCKEDRSWDKLTNFAQTFIDLDKDRIRHSLTWTKIESDIH